MAESSDAEHRKQYFAGIFDRAGTTYDQIGPKLFTHFGQRLVNDAHIPKGADVLDVATGRGAVLFAAARAVGRRGTVMGTDISETMVNETNREIMRRELKNVKIQQMDAEKLKFPDECFDFVLCGFALFFFPNLEKALAEMRRVLRPGGCLAVTTWEKYEDERWTWFDKLVEVFLPPEEEKPPDPNAPPPTPELDTPEAMKSVLEEAGFRVERSRSENLDAVYQDDEQWWTVQWSHGGRALMERIEEKLGADGLERFRQEVFERLKTIRQQDGIHTSWPALFTLARKPRGEERPDVFPR